MEQYLALLRAAMQGEKSTNERTGAGTVGVFIEHARFNLAEGFPLVTTKQIHFPSILGELLWFLRGETNIQPLLQEGVGIWSSDCLRFNLEKVINYGVLTADEVAAAQADAKKGIYRSANRVKKRFEKAILADDEFAQLAGDLGPVYGAQWRGTNGATATDQILGLEDQLKNNPASRYKLVDAWNPVDKPRQALPACHMLWQVHVSPESNKLTLGWVQRSCDTILGVPYNIASYGLLANLLAHTHEFDLGKLEGTFNDLHVYLPHLKAAEEQLTRKPKPLPKLEILTKRDSITEYTADDIKLVDYDPHPKLSHPTPMFGGFF